MLDNTLALALALIGAGLLILALELFIPTGGIFFVVAIVAIVAGVAVPFLRGETTKGWFTAGGVVVALPIFTVLLFKLWPRTPMGRRMFQTGPTPEEDATVASLPVNQELEQIKGRVGRAVSPLRPSGTVDFDGRRIDCLSEGVLVEVGTWVRCIDVKVGKVIVRPVKEPSLGDLEAADFS